jgi:nitroreductase/NAD-dependent dihydropyrimidine dehydrogenase PreA subunit
MANQVHLVRESGDPVVAGGLGRVSDQVGSQSLDFSSKFDTLGSRTDPRKEYAMDLDQLKEIVRPKDVHMGVMEVDVDNCTSCGLCVDNCPFSCWEMEEGGYPQLKGEYECFSCYNCMVACPTDAISIVEAYNVTSGFWATEPHPLPAKMPLRPRDVDGNLDEWNAMERAVLERRSVRNFKDEPVPDHLIRRVLEAGRFAPSAGNCQPWQFIVITDKALIAKMDEATWATVNGMYGMYRNDELIPNMAPMAENTPGLFDPRVALGGMGAIVGKHLPASLNAPCVILLAADSRAISGAQLNIGICGQNMNLVANSLGIKACWNGFLVTGVPAIADKIDLKPNWSVITTLVLGWPAFKQEGIVPREYRPVMWLREGSEAVEIEE